MRSIFLLIVLSLSPVAKAAPCCGGAANVPNLISGDDRAQLSLGLSHASTFADSLPGGELRDRSGEDSEVAQTFRLDAATLISDRWQLGLSLPLVRRSRARANAADETFGLADLNVSIGYEILPLWDYSPWRPKGFLFIDVIVPTGRSAYESTALYRLDSRGRGFWGAGAGMYLLKNWGDWDVSLLGEFHRSIGKTIATASGSLTLHPGWGAQTVLATGWSPGAGNFRLGLALGFSHEDGVATSGVIGGEGAPIRTLTPSAQVAYLVDSSLSLNATYSDASLIGGNSNTALQRSIGLVVQKRWER